MKSWAKMAIDAQELLDRAIYTAKNPTIAQAEGRAVWLSTNQLKAVEMVLNRALGKPKIIREQEIGENLADAIKRIAASRRQMALPSGECIAEIPSGD
jgi:hypothetical protein